MKKYFLKFFISFCLLSMVGGVFAKTSSPSARDQLAEVLQSWKTLQMDFTQVMLANDGSELHRSSGIMFIKRPGLFRSETQKPAYQLIVMDGKNIWMYDKDLEQVTVQKQKNIAAGAPALLLSGDTETVLKRFQVTRIIKRGSEGDWYRLIDTARSPLFHSVELNFQDRILKEMLITDLLGQVSDIHFDHVIINPSLDRNLFQFIPPKGVDVIHLDH